MLDAHRPMFGACLSAQQIAMTTGAKILDAPYKEVGCFPVYLKDTTLSDVSKALTAVHWYQQMFEIPAGAKHLFSSDLVENQGFLLEDNVIGLQFYFEPEEIIAHGVLRENKEVMFKLLNFITKK